MKIRAAHGAIQTFPTRSRIFTRLVKGLQATTLGRVTPVSLRERTSGP
jgi:hypothetical protein